MGYWNGMYIDMGMRFSMNFSHEKLSGKISCNFIGAGIGMPVSSGNFFQKFWSLKIWSHRIPGKILEQYYQNNHSQ